MSGEVAMIDGVAQMAFLEEEGMPWHGLGTALPKDLTPEEWIQAAGLDWEAQRKPLFTFNDDGQLIQMGKNVLVHSKTQQDLGYVTDNYKIVQPREIMDAFKEIAEGAGYKLRTAGNLRDGRRIWALADCGDEFSVSPDGKDVVKRSILLATGFDGSMATVADPTSVRVVCQNTLAAAVGYGGEGAKVRISHLSDFDPAEIRNQLLKSSGEIESSWEVFKEQAMRLASRKVSTREATEYFMKLFAKPDEDGNLVLSDDGRSQRTMKQVIDLYQNGQGQETTSAQGTAWGLVNAVTRWTDHERTSTSNESRLNSAFFGTGFEKKLEAMETALELAA